MRILDSGVPTRARHYEPLIGTILGTILTVAHMVDSINKGTPLRHQYHTLLLGAKNGAPNFPPYTSDQ